MMNGIETRFFKRSPGVQLLRTAESSECGLACLGMVANYHGHKFDMPNLRSRFSMSISGSSIKALIEISAVLGLSARALRVDLDDLCHLTLPAVLHWDFKHFVVLTEVSKTQCTIFDPSVGKRAISLIEASPHFTGVALEFSKSTDFAPLTEKADVRLSNLWSSQRGLRSSIIKILSLSVFLQVLTFVGPFQTQLVVDQAIAQSDSQLLAVIAFAFASLVVIQVMIEAVRSWFVQAIGASFSFQIISNVLNHLLRLPSSFFEKRHIGDIISRMQSTSVIREVLMQGLAVAVVDAALAVSTVVVLAIYSLDMALVVYVTLMINAVISVVTLPALRRRLEKGLTSSAEEQSYLLETIRAQQAFRLTGGEVMREQGWKALYARVVNASLSTGRLTITTASLQNIVMGLQFVIVVYLGAQKVITATGFSVGMLLAFLSFRQTLSDRANSLIQQITQIRLLRLHVDRLSDIVQSPADGLAYADELTGKEGIFLENVMFRYGVGLEPVFDDVNLEIKFGDFVAISGPSGGGKTTLVKLILGLHSPSSGLHRIGEHIASAAVLRSWRKHVGVVSQSDQLLSGSIHDNISFFDEDATDEQVILAAKRAQIHFDILKMPMQYNTLIGDMGSSLSGGQKQRVLLARALYRNPMVLILDEGTANLDEATEERISDLVENMNITRIVVAHRPSLLRRAQRQVFVGGSRVVEPSLAQ